MTKALVKRGGIVFIGESLGSVLTLSTGLLIARNLGVTQFGQFAAALALALIVAFLSDFGMGQVLARSIARNETDTWAINQLVTFRLGLIVILWTISGAAVPWILPAGRTQSIAFVLIPALTVIALSDLFEWMLKGAGRPWHAAGLVVGGRLCLLVFTFISLRSVRPVAALMVAYCGCALISVIAGYICARYAGIRVSLMFPTKTYLALAMPPIIKIGTLLTLCIAFPQLDLMLIPRFCGDHASGIYASAAKVIDGIRLIPIALYAAIFPVFASLHSNPRGLRQLFVKVLIWTACSSVAIGIGGNQLGHVLVTLLYGPDYSASVPYLQGLIWTVIPMCVNIVLFAFLYAHNDLRTPTVGILLAIAVNILGNTLGLPHFGLKAAVYSRLFAEISNMCCLFYGVYRMFSRLRDVRPPLLLLTGASREVEGPC